VTNRDMTGNPANAANKEALEKVSAMRERLIREVQLTTSKEQVVIHGEYALEGILEFPAGDVAGGVVISHPHPSYGGTMVNPVVHHMARGCQAQNLATLRFNFRGVGNSEGSYSHSREYRDVSAAARFLRGRLAEEAGVVLAGYSFGAGMSALAVAQGAEGTEDVAGLALVAGVIGVFSALFNPSQVRVVGQLVSSDKLVKANSYLSVSREGAEIGGYLVGGALVASLGYFATFTVDAATYGVSALLLLGLPDTGGGEKGTPRLRHLLKGSLQAVDGIWRSKRLRTNLLFALLPFPFLMMGTPNAYGLALDVFDKGPQGFALMEVLTSGGWIAGGLIAGRMNFSGDRNGYVYWSVLAMAACMVAVGLSGSFWVAVAFLTLGAAANVGLIVGSMTLYQEIQERPDKGRMIAIRAGFGQMSMTLGLLGGAFWGSTSASPRSSGRLDSPPSSWERWYICPTVCGGALPARAPALTPTERISSPSPRARCRRPEVAGRSVRSSRSCGSLFVTLMDCSLKALIMIDSTVTSAERSAGQAPGAGAQEEGNEEALRVGGMALQKGVMLHSLRPALRCGRARGGGSCCGDSGLRSIFPPLCPRVCGGCYDLRGGGGADPGVATWRARRPGHHGGCDRFCGDDGSGRCSRLRTRRSDALVGVPAVRRHDGSCRRLAGVVLERETEGI